MESVIYHDVGGIFRGQGIDAVLDSIHELVVKHQPGMVVIDSLKAIGDLLVSPYEFRGFMADLAVRVALWECTVLLVGEYAEEQILSLPEAAIVDGILLLYGNEDRETSPGGTYQ